MHPNDATLAGLFSDEDFLPRTREGLRALLQRPPGLAAFDFDNTCIRGDISETLLQMIEHHDPTGRVEQYESACLGDLKAAYVQLVHTLVAGRTEAETWSLSKQAFAWGLSSGRIQRRPHVERLILALQYRGWEVYVVTASPTSVVRPHAHTLGITPDKVLGMTSRIGQDGRFLPELIPPIPYREGKGELLRSVTGRDPTFAAGDSQYDMGILAPAEHVLLFDRGDVELRNMAIENNWWLEEGR